jgi:hypothetical protein
MPKKVFIHVGFHKTGTTAIQESLFTNSKALKVLGTTYARTGKKASHRAAWALSGKTWGWKDRGGVKTPISEWNKLLRKIKLRKSQVVISSEFFSELSDQHLSKLALDLKGMDVHIIFTIRPFSKMLSSSYQQYLKYGLKASYEEWLKDIFAVPNKSKLSPSFWKRHNHAKVIDRWQRTFGSQNIHLIVVDENEPDHLYRSFEEILKLPKQTLNAGNSVGSNRSLSHTEISLLLAINKAFPANRSWPDYELFIRNGVFRYITDEIKLTDLDERLLTPQWALDASKEFSEKNVRKIESLNLNIYGDLQELLTSDVAVGVNNEISEIFLNVAASALLAFEKKAVLQKYSSKEIYLEALRRFKKFIIE